RVRGSDTLSWKPVKEVLPKLNLPGHRITRWRYNLIPVESKFKTPCSIIKDKYMMKAQNDDDKEEEYEEEYIHIPENYESTNDEDKHVDEEEYDHFDEELYKDVNVKWNVQSMKKKGNKMQR
nr:hypothetical protein [Tanacetum cinerariifolium]